MLPVRYVCNPVVESETLSQGYEGPKGQRLFGYVRNQQRHAEGKDLVALYSIAGPGACSVAWCLDKSFS